jgi:predicted dithiol-disulfide oxidoreductase (DUF899 family)
VVPYVVLASERTTATGSAREVPCYTYSTFGRGTEQFGGAYNVLDLTALGRQEDWEQPAGRVSDPYPAIADFAE